MLLTLAVRDPARILGKRGKALLLDVPEFAIKQLGLRGLNIFSSSLAGWSIEDLDRLRDRADKAGCPCLVLVEDTPLRFCDRSPKEREAARERVRRLAAAANRLGCNSIAVSCAGKDNAEDFENTALSIREAMPAVERMELNLLIAPTSGLTADPERLAELIKRIGGFRIGSLPSFGQAGAVGDAPQVLRKIAPYAGAIHATVSDFGKNGKHSAGYDLAACVQAIRAVGFTNTLAIDYVGTSDPVVAIETARDILQPAIDAEQ